MKSKALGSIPLLVHPTPLYHVNKRVVGATSQSRPMHALQNVTMAVYLVAIQEAIALSLGPSRFNCPTQRMIESLRSSQPIHISSSIVSKNQLTY